MHTASQFNSLGLICLAHANLGIALVLRLDTATGYVLLCKS